MAKQTEKLPVVTIHTDGACSPNPGAGGWAAVMQYQNYKQELFGGYQWTSSNRMEMLALIRALDNLNRPHTILLFSDSTYLVRPIQQNKVKHWIKANDNGKFVKNIDLWRRIHRHMKQHNIIANWIRGHDNNTNNERCDYLAKTMRMSKKSLLEEDTEYLDAQNAMKTE